MGGISSVEYLYNYNSQISGSNLAANPLSTTKKAKGLVFIANDNRGNGQCYLGVVIDGINENHYITGSKLSYENFDALFTFNDNNITISQVSGAYYNWKFAFAILYD